MKISAQMTIVIAALFAIACFSIAITGFASLGELEDPAVIADAKGYAMFWAFLGTIGVVMGAVSYWIVKTGKND